VDFSGGITKVTNIASHEWPGILLVFRCPSGYNLLSNHFDDNERKFEKKRKNQQKKEEFHQNQRKTLSETSLLTRGECLHLLSGNTLKNNEVVDHNGLDMEVNEQTDQDYQPTMAQCTINNFVEMCKLLLSIHTFYKQRTY
jgi:hypothetical protein